MKLTSSPSDRAPQESGLDRAREDKHYTETGQERELSLPKIVMDFPQIEDTTGDEAETEHTDKKRLLVG